MAVTVIQVLEPVEVDKGAGERNAARDMGVDLTDKGAPVEDSRERVFIGQRLDFLFGDLALGNFQRQLGQHRCVDRVHGFEDVKAGHDAMIAAILPDQDEAVTDRPVVGNVTPDDIDNPVPDGGKIHAGLHQAVDLLLLVQRMAEGRGEHRLE